MTDKRESKDATIAGTTGTDTVHERRKANPTAGEMTDPREVWKEGETTPSASATARGASGRVADAGDLAEGQPSPYSLETQADALAKQSGRDGKPGAAEKPKQ